MRARRFFFFLLAIALGVGLGVAYGWMISPPAYANLKPETLRYDYKADYILMIAEVYRKDGNLASAIGGLARLDNQPPEQQVGQALVSASKLAYSQSDLQTLAYLARALQSGDSTPATLTPDTATQVTPTLDTAIQPTLTPSAESNP